MITKSGILSTIDLQYLQDQNYTARQIDFCKAVVIYEGFVKTLTCSLDPAYVCDAKVKSPDHMIQSVCHARVVENTLSSMTTPYSKAQ